jgi:ubiquinone/menaquinone biosynthesis C-methylase UbiE
MTESIKIISKEEYLKKNKNKKPEQEEVWDNISDLWNEYRKEPFDIVKEFLKGKKGLVIDLGCGSGRNMVANPDISYYGVDFSENQLECARKSANEKGMNAKFFKSSADNLPKDFKDEMFDYGLFIATLHCIEGEKNRTDALKEFYRVLKKGAVGLISIWNSNDVRFKHVNNRGDVYLSWKKDGKEFYRYYYLYSNEELFDLLSRVGFEILEVNDKTSDRFSKKNLIVKVQK